MHYISCFETFFMFPYLTLPLNTKKFKYSFAYLSEFFSSDSESAAPGSQPFQPLNSIREKFLIGSAEIIPSFLCIISSAASSAQRIPMTVRTFPAPFSSQRLSTCRTLKKQSLTPHSWRLVLSKSPKAKWRITFPI